MDFGASSSKAMLCVLSLLILTGPQGCGDRATRKDQGMKDSPGCEVSLELEVLETPHQGFVRGILANRGTEVALFGQRYDLARKLASGAWRSVPGVYVFAGLARELPPGEMRRLVLAFPRGSASDEKPEELAAGVYRVEVPIRCGKQEISISESFLVRHAD